MPSWNIHLSIAKRINKTLKLNKNIFYYANLLPDVDYNMKINRKESHYENKICDNCPIETLPNLNDFLKEYKSKLNSPLIMGYYVHLFTDYFYNNYTFSNKWLLKDNKFITLNEVKTRINYLNSKEFIKYNKLNIITKIFGYKYKLFTKKELDNIYEECIEFILSNIENNFL